MLRMGINLGAIGNFGNSENNAMSIPQNKESYFPMQKFSGVVKGGRGVYMTGGGKQGLGGLSRLR